MIDTNQLLEQLQIQLSRIEEKLDRFLGNSEVTERMLSKKTFSFEGVTKETIFRNVGLSVRLWNGLVTYANIGKILEDSEFEVNVIADLPIWIVCSHVSMTELTRQHNLGKVSIEEFRQLCKHINVIPKK